MYLPSLAMCFYFFYTAAMHSNEDATKINRFSFNMTKGQKAYFWTSFKEGFALVLQHVLYLPVLTKSAQGSHKHLLGVALFPFREAGFTWSSFPSYAPVYLFFPRKIGTESLFQRFYPTT